VGKTNEVPTVGFAVFDTASFFQDKVINRVQKVGIDQSKMGKNSSKV